MRAVALIALTVVSGCSVPYEVDPNFGLDATADSTIEDTTVAESSMDTGGELDSSVPDAEDTSVSTDGADSMSVDVSPDGDSASDVVDTTVEMDSAPDTVVVPPDTACSGDLTTDVNNCGMCGKVCTTTNGTPACVASSCAIGSCSVGFSSCDGEPSACELEHAVGSNTCATAQSLGFKGKTTICGSGPEATTTAPATTTSSRFFKLSLERCPPCTPSSPMRARISLANPAGVAYDLFVWSGSACVGAPTKTAASGVLGGTETVTLDDLGCGASSEVSIEMRYRAGGSCEGLTITATGAY